MTRYSSNTIELYQVFVVKCFKISKLYTTDTHKKYYSVKIGSICFRSFSDNPYNNMPSQKSENIFYVHPRSISISRSISRYILSTEFSDRLFASDLLMFWIIQR